MGILDSLKNLCCCSKKVADENNYSALSLDEKASKFIDAVGGKANIENIEFCITRLRLTLNDRSLVNKGELTKLGSKGNVKVGDKGLQIIIGSKAEEIANLMQSKI
ncbi:PTS glucose/sucrose transporter subunit IIB [Pasteurella atlantica]|uniref:PTS glucose/sucrose transporter subunit IIB n=2 Tax=Pasteurellaceae TaxID=712 RepID=A0ACC6HPA0_9PAST|nr:PTS glucose/sucrose transporter subunit IIB [Pasteurella atlantica]MDP8052705.1 PTS glucose/sucrose transporter subunit IIB [Pasteurella atlantica]MDP8105977.1 PTS glucose/sucrose transporter subunit IIB [Pasteurella atlantica]MDP8149368.1 PTS glucose/sucrose transporter subunit IIB [Pasteurella atlantica]